MALTPDQNRVVSDAMMGNFIEEGPEGFVKSAGRSGGMIWGREERRLGPGPESKFKSPHPSNFWAAISENKKNKLRFAGWTGGIGNKIVPNVLSQAGNSPLRFLGEKEFYATLNMIGAKKPGSIATQQIYQMFKSRGITPSVAIHGIPFITEKGGKTLRRHGAELAKRPSVSFIIPGSQGKELINLPFEYEPGLVSRSGKLYSARRWITGKGRDVGFSDLLMERLGFIGHAEHKDIPRLFREAMRGFSEDKILSPETHSGTEMMSRARIRRLQYAFAPDHPYSVAIAGLKERQRQFHTSAAKQDVEARMTSHGKDLENFYGQARGDRYKIHGIKYENLFSKAGEDSASIAIAMRDVDLYPGLNLGKLDKGIHQLFQRQMIRPGIARRKGFERGLPWVMSPGQGLNYEVPMRVGYLRGAEDANLLLGDSSFIIGNSRVIGLAGQYPHRMSLKLNVASIVGDSSVREIDRRLSPWMRKLMEDPNVRRGLSEDMFYEFNKPMGIRGLRRKPLLIGVSTTRVGSGEVVSGRNVVLPQGYGIKAIRARGLPQGMEYEFIASRPQGRAPLGSMGWLLAGTKRMSTHRAVKLQMDLLVRGEEIFGSKQVKQTTITGHWFDIAKRSGLKTDELADYLGLKRSKRWLRTPVYTGGDDWAVGLKKANKVRQWFYKGLNLKKGTEAYQTFNRMFIRGQRTPIDPDAARIMLGQTPMYDAATDTFTAKGRNLYNRLVSGHAVNVYGGVPVGIRAGVDAGLRQTRGFRLRLDHYYAMTERLGEDPAMDSLYKAHAKTIRRLIGKRAPLLTQETRNLLEPIIGPHKGKPAPVISVGEYKGLFQTPVPSMSGGSALEELVDTALGSKSGRYVRLPGTIQVYGGSPKDLAFGGGKQFYGTSKIWIPSQEMLHLGQAPSGAYYSNPMIREFRFLDKLLRGDVHGNLKEIELQYNKLAFVIRKGLFGKDGRLVPTVRIKRGIEGRLGFRGAGTATEALDLFMTENAFRKAYGKGAEKKITFIKGGGNFFASAAVEPLQFSAHYVPAMRVRLMTAEEMVPLAAKFGGEPGNFADIDKVILASEAVVTIGQRDHDLDTIRAILWPGVGHQKRLEKVWANNTKYYDWASRMAKEELGKMPGAADMKVEQLLPGKGANAITSASRWADYMRTKYATPVPELFFRSRRRLLSAAMEGGAELEAIGMGKLAKAGLTYEHKAAYSATAQMVQQQFLGKARSFVPAFRAMNEILAYGRRGGGSTKGVKKAIVRALQAAVQDKKFVAPNLGAKTQAALASHGVNPNNIDELIEWTATKVADATRRIEGAVADTPFLDQFHGSFRGVNPFKSPAQMARDMGTAGGAVGEEAEGLARNMYEWGVQTGIVPKRRQYEKAIEWGNKMAGIPAKAAKAGKLGEMWGKGIGNTISEAIQASGKGIAALWRSGAWGKVAIGTAGLILGKGMLDLFSGGDTISTTSGPMPPGGMPSQGNDAPGFAMGGPPIGLQEIDSGGGFGMSGRIGNPMFQDLQQALVGEMVDMPGGYGYMIDDNLPENEFSMESYIASKMRSDF